MSNVLAGIGNIRSETSAEALRREIVERAERALDRSLRVRRLVIAASVAFSLGQAAYTAANPALSEIPFSSAVTWGVPLVASLVALGLVWSCRLHLEQSQCGYSAYLRATTPVR